MLPHEASGGCTPSPRNDSEASARIANATLSEACTTIGVAAFGRTWRQAMRQLGAPGWRIAWHHVLPNATTPIVVQASLSVAFAILAEASLSFLGLGVQPPQASWGSMINAGRGYLQQAPWIVFGPGAALFVTVVGLNFVGDAVRDALDPRARG